MGFSIIILLFAGVAQSVVQLIRNQQVVCSSHITSSIGVASKRMQRLFFIRFILRGRNTLQLQKCAMKG